MRLAKYINEQEVLDFEDRVPEAIALLKKECRYYFSLLKGKKPLFRGIFGITGGPLDMQLVKKFVRQDRKPLGTDPAAFKKFNEWLRENKHTRRDKAVIATSSEDHAGVFGTPYFFFPIGRFNYTWLRGKDVNDSDSKTGWHMLNVENFFDPEFMKTDEGKKLAEKFPNFFTTNKGFDEAYKNKYETWFDCKEYYVSRTDDEIGELVRKGIK